MSAAALVDVPAEPGPSQHVVVKTVHAPLALEWVATRFEPAVVVVLRHPLNVIASLLELGLPDRDRGLDRDPVIRQRLLEPLGIRAPSGNEPDAWRTAWQVGLLTTALEGAATRNPEWAVVTHEDLCVEPDRAFQALCERLGLPWSDEIGRHLAESDRPGTGFSTNRVRSDEPDRWRRRLTAEQIEQAARALREFDLPRWDVNEQLASGGWR